MKLESSSYFTDLFIVHASIANLEHVQVVPTTWLSSVNVRSYLVDDVKHGAVRAGCDAVRISWVVTAAESVWASE
jgi:hypothetical protein